MKLPALQQAELDPATLDALFADLAACADLDEVVIRGAQGPATLAQAQAALVAGARAVQIRYRWDGSAWIDTLMRTSSGVRLVRTAITAPEEQP